ncbi:TIGR04141 family sporadically distributed protein [Bacillus pumilus]|uniref:DUF6119 family protein n=1 Tax=Bacillus TaxID=1386 RepID=UPI000D02431F|nr:MULTISPECIES: DUF6119 family protein [Bacillus]MCK6164945.1 TIGR04141 family sporadically distributed protein [Bacillus pumilus]MCK6185504.1 TIGR04141 family sporadically distributed protein [Bacillus pumilus]PRS47702.1 hypothetical protein C6Y05_15490 [Bacillus sp. LNXM10]
MYKINLYKIDERNHRTFFNYLEEKLVYVGNKALEDEEGEKYSFSLFKINEEVDKEISWNWILNEFEQSLLSVKTQSKAVLALEYDDEMYAVTFGSAFFLVDKYCDRNFAFEFARRMKYLEIKTTTLLSPNMQRNKNISTYINYEVLEFDSGESFAKLKAKLNLDEFNNPLIGETVEFGKSIKFDLKVSNLENLSKLLKFIKLTLNQDEIYKIPVFNNVTEKDLLIQLEANLFSKIEENSNVITISELDIIGVSEIFNNQDTFFELWHGHKRKEIESLNFAEVEKFAEEKEIELSREILNIKVKSFNNGKSIRTDKIKNLIDYVDDDNRCVLNKGIWYHYNDDYQKYLEDSISEIEVIYNQEYDFSDSIHQDFIDEKFNTEKEETEFEELLDSKIKEKLKNKYYAERAFNLLRVRDGFENYDRVTNSYAGAKIELMDLYKDETMYAVKIGSKSSTLCYAVDQSISSLKMYKHNTLEGMPAIKNVAVWLVLKRQPLPLNENGQPDLSTLNMIMLKNKLDSWKKEVRLQGLNPIVYINYKQ